MDESVHGRLREGILNGDASLVEQAARAVLDGGLDIDEALAVLTESLREVGEMFSRMDLFLPDLMLAADAMNAGVSILEAGLTARGQGSRRAGTVVLGTVKGDMHDIGKNLVSTMLRVNGFEVIDLGIDVPITKFVEKAEEVHADIVGMSSLLTTSQAAQREVIRFLVDSGVRHKYYVIIGGGAMTPEWTRAVGADGYAEFASGAVELCCQLLAQRPPAPVQEPIIC